MMKKMNKLLCLSLLFGLGTNTCYAANANFIGQLVDSGGTSSEETEVPYSDWADYPSDNHIYQYRYRSEINSATTISMNAYDLEGESIIPHSVTIDPDKYKFKAGTWIGINVTETHGANWKVYDFDYQEKLKKYTCNYTVPSTAYTCYEPTTVTNVNKEYCDGESGVFSLYPDTVGGSSGRGSCKYNKAKTCYTDSRTEELTYEKPYNESFSCPQTYPNTNYSLSSQEVETISADFSDAEIENIMKEKATDEVHKKALDSVKWSAGTVKYITNNSYPKDIKDLEYKTINDGQSVKAPIDKVNSDGVSGYVEQAYEILERKVCMNLKTSQVSYGRDCKTSEGEIQIETGTVTDTYLNNKVNYWHYFIPLNTTSDSVFTLDIVKNENRKFSISECKQFMSTNNEYINYIVPIDLNNNNGTFVGDYNRYTDKNLSLDNKKLQTGGGCYISTKITFPIVQEFYNEKTTTKNGETTKQIKGFNFYYKPIDIENPFPNGILSTSIWHGWDKLKNKTPDVAKSFEQVTYIASEIDSNAVRSYTKNNPYTSWKNMKLDGTSKYIDNAGIIKRNTKNNIYALGCGPANENEYLDNAKKVKNQRYIKGCDKQ